MNKGFSRLGARMAGTLPLVLVSACVTLDPPPLPESDVPVLWQGPVEEAAGVWPDIDWWNAFNDAELSALIEQVKANNLDLANNERNLRSAQIALEEAGFTLFPAPQLTIGTSASASRTDINGISSSSSSTGPFQLVGSVSYSGILSRPANYQRSVADYDSRVAQTASVALNTLGTATSTYFQILLIRDRIEAARQNLANAEEIAAIAEARLRAGVSVPIDLLQQQIAIERERTNLSSLVQSDLAARSSLALLLGRSVQGFDVDGQTLQIIEVPKVQPGLPSELLVRRPDLIQAEASVRSANANVAVVRTAFLPNISLTSNNSASSSSLANLVSSPDTALSISANLVQTLLDTGQRRRNLEQARITLENSLSSYRRAVLAAFNEIEVQLSNIQLLEAQGQVAARNLEAAEEAFRIAQVRYEAGVADYQTILTSQNTLFANRNALLDNKLQQLNATLALVQALGGGWHADNLIVQ
jgi:outer membrane protein, multidrug efflux system